MGQGLGRRGAEAARDGRSRGGQYLSDASMTSTVQKDTKKEND
jgi:hypothetical protein